MYQIVPLSCDRLATDDGEVIPVLELRDGSCRGFVVAERNEFNRGWGYAFYEPDLGDKVFLHCHVWPPGVAHLVGQALPVDAEVALRMVREQRGVEQKRVDLHITIALSRDDRSISDAEQQGVDALLRYLEMLDRMPGVRQVTQETGSGRVELGFQIEPGKLEQAIDSVAMTVQLDRDDPLTIMAPRTQRRIVWVQD